MRIEDQARDKISVVRFNDAAKIMFEGLEPCDAASHSIAYCGGNTKFVPAL